MISEAALKWKEANSNLQAALASNDEARIKECREKLSALEQEEIRDVMKTYGEWSRVQLATELALRGIDWYDDEDEIALRRRLAEDDTGLQSAVLVASD